MYRHFADPSGSCTHYMQYVFFLYTGYLPITISYNFNTFSLWVALASCLPVRIIISRLLLSLVRIAPVVVVSHPNLAALMSSVSLSSTRLPLSMLSFFLSSLLLFLIKKPVLLFLSSNHCSSVASSCCCWINCCCWCCCCHPFPLFPLSGYARLKHHLFRVHLSRY